MSFFFVLLALAGLVVAIGLLNRFVAAYRLIQRELEETRRQRDENVRFLNEFSHNLGTVGQIDDAYRHIAHHVCDTIGAESLGIFLIEPDDDEGQILRGASVYGAFPAFTTVVSVVMTRPRHRRDHIHQEILAVGEGIIGTVALTGKSVLIARPDENQTGFELPREVETLMAMPMYVDTKLTGVICAVNRKKEGPGFSRDELRLFGELSSQAAFAVNLVSVYSVLSRNQGMEQQMSFGRELQQSLLPGDVPEWGDYRLAAYAESALEVAGDYYDFIPIDEDRLMLVVADATGKGVPACMLVAMFRACARSFAKDYRGMEDFLRRLNTQLQVDTDVSHFITMAALVINRKTYICEYGNAGHTPLLIRSGDGNPVAIQPDGPALGLFPQEFGIDFDTLSFRFRPGMEMLLFTDGITEALDRDDREFGLERLEKLWRENPGEPEQMKARIIETVNAFSTGVERADDQTILIVSRRPEASPSLPAAAS